MNAGITDQCIEVAKPCGYESHFITTIAAPLLPFINWWCLEIGWQYALLMRANKPKTAVQSSALFLLAPHGLSIMHINVPEWCRRFSLKSFSISQPHMEEVHAILIVRLLYMLHCCRCYTIPWSTHRGLRLYLLELLLVGRSCRGNNKREAYTSDERVTV